MTEPSQPDTDSSTPIPWMRNGQTTNDWWRIDGSSDRVGADFLLHPAAIVPDEADADLIVRAVNNHAKLLKALEGLTEFSHDWHEADGSPIPGLEAANRIARTAIEEAQS